MFVTFAIGAATMTLGQDRPFFGNELKPLPRPILAIPGLTAKNMADASYYMTKESRDQTTVFRYVMRGDMKTALKAFQAILPAKEGWKLEWSKSNIPSETGKIPILDRTLTKGPVVMQAIVIHSGKLVRGPRSWQPVSGKSGAGWVWVSYNEAVRAKK